MRQNIKYILCYVLNRVFVKQDWQIITLSFFESQLFGIRFLFTSFSIKYWKKGKSLLNNHKQVQNQVFVKYINEKAPNLLESVNV